MKLYAFDTSVPIFNRLRQLPTLPAGRQAPTANHQPSTIN